MILRALHLTSLLHTTPHTAVQFRRFLPEKCNGNCCSPCFKRQAYSGHGPQDPSVRRNRKPDGTGVSMCKSNHSSGSKVDTKLIVTSFRPPHTTPSSLLICGPHFDQCPVPVWKVTSNHMPSMACWQKICRT
jgi:hypothetical protein